MRGLRLLIAAVLAGLLTLTAGCSTVDQQSPQPSGDDVTAATTFLSSTNEADGKKGDETWLRAVVLTTHLTKDGWGPAWSMSVLLVNGQTRVFSGDSGTDKDRLNTGFTAGDYIVIKDTSDSTFNESGVTVLKKAAVTIKGQGH